MGVSENSGIPKLSILIGISIINHPFLGYPYLRKHRYRNYSEPLFWGTFFVRMSQRSEAAKEMERLKASFLWKVQVKVKWQDVWKLAEIFAEIKKT